MDYCDKFSKVLFNAGVFPVRPRDITVDPNCMAIYKNFLRDMMFLMWDVIGASRVLRSMRGIGQHHAITNTSDEGGDDDEGGDQGSSGSTTPSDHNHQGFSDLSSSTPHYHSPDDEIP